MPFNGSGGFDALSPPTYPAVSGEVIYASRFNLVIGDILTGLGQCVTRGGQSPATANLPMGGYKHTGVGDALAAGQYLAYGQSAAAALGGALNVSGLISALAGLAVTGETNTTTLKLNSKSLLTAQSFSASATPVSNVDSVSSNGAFYLRFADLVLVAYQLSLNCTATGGFQFLLTCPETHNFTNTYDAVGFLSTGQGSVITGGGIADTSNEMLNFYGTTDSTAASVVNALALYKVS